MSRTTAQAVAHAADAVDEIGAEFASKVSDVHLGPAAAEAGTAKIPDIAIVAAAPIVAMTISCLMFSSRSDSNALPMTWAWRPILKKR